MCIEREVNRYQDDEEAKLKVANRSGHKYNNNNNKHTHREREREIPMTYPFLPQIPQVGQVVVDDDR